MTRHDDRDWIRSACLGYCARRLRTIYRLRNIEIRSRFSGRDRQQLAPDFALEIGALQVERERAIEFAPSDSFTDGIQGWFECRIIAL
jgi:hypothetical protein